MTEAEIPNQPFTEADNLEQRIEELLIQKRDTILSRKEELQNPNELSSFSEGKCNLEDKIANRYIMVFRTRGCTWACEKGGCTMCGFLSESTKGKDVIAEQLITQFRSQYEKIDRNKYPVFHLFSGGSLLNDKEFSPVARKEILNILAQNPSIKKIFIESRVEDITEKKLAEIKETVGDKKLEIGIGLEAVSPEVRKLCVHKGTDLERFKKAVNLVKNFQIDPIAYVLIKTPFLTEKEGIEEAIQTVRYAFDQGVKGVSLEPLYILKNSLVDDLFKEGRCRPTWLWSVIEVIKQTHNLGALRLGMFEQLNIDSERAPSNCDKCTREGYIKISQYDQEQDPSVFNDFNCQCKTQWADELQKPAPPLQERVKKYLDQTGV